MHNDSSEGVAKMKNTLMCVLVSLFLISISGDMMGLSIRSARLVPIQLCISRMDGTEYPGTGMPFSKAFPDPSKFYTHYHDSIIFDQANKPYIPCIFRTYQQVPLMEPIIGYSYYYIDSSLMVHPPRQEIDRRYRIVFYCSRLFPIRYQIKIYVLFKSTGYHWDVNNPLTSTDFVLEGNITLQWQDSSSAQHVIGEMSYDQTQKILYGKFSFDLVL